MSRAGGLSSALELGQRLPAIRLGRRELERAPLVRLGAPIIARRKIDGRRQRLRLGAQRDGQRSVERQVPQLGPRRPLGAGRQLGARQRQAIERLVGIVVAGRAQKVDRARRIDAHDPARLGDPRGQLARADAAEDGRASKLLGGVRALPRAERLLGEELAPFALEIPERHPVDVGEVAGRVVERPQLVGAARGQQERRERSGQRVGARARQRAEPGPHHVGQRRRQPGGDHRRRLLMNRRVAGGIADGGRLGHPFDEAHGQRRVGQGAPAPGQRHAEEGIAEAPGEHVGHLVSQPRRGEMFLDEHLARPGLGVQRLPRADQRLLHRAVREVPHGDRQLGLVAECLAQLLVTELQVLDLQRPLGAALGAGHGVDDEVRGGLGLTQLARQVFVRDVEPEPAPESVEDDRSYEQRERRGAGPPVPAPRVPATPDRRQRQQDPGGGPDRGGDPEQHQRQRRAQRLVVDRAREISAERVEGKHRRIAVEAQQRPEDGNDRQREGEQTPAAGSGRRQSRQHPRRRGVKGAAERQQREEGEADRQAAVADAQGVAEAEQQRQQQRRRRGDRRFAEDAGQLTARRRPPQRRPRARHHPLTDVDPGQGDAEPDREGEVVAEEVVEGNEVERQRQQRQQAAPDERAECPSALARWSATAPACQPGAEAPGGIDGFPGGA